MTTDTMLERIPPQSLEAEQAALGALLIDSRTLVMASTTLRMDDLYREAHRTIYRGILDLYQRREPVDLITLGEWLKARDELDAVGGTFYLQTIMSHCPTATNLPNYIEIIRGKAVQRATILAADAILAAAYENDRKPEDLVAFAGQRLDAITHNYQTAASSTKMLSDLLREVFEDQDTAVTAGQTVGIKTGWRDLNSSLAPIQPHQLIVIAARPKMGKTALALNLAMTWAEWDLPGAFYSMEMAGKELARRALLRDMNHTQEHLNDIEYCQQHPEVMQEMAAFVERLWSLPIAINDRPGLTIQEIDASLRELRHTKGIQWAMVDYMQLAHSGRRTGSRTEEVNEIVRGLKNLAKQHEIPIIALTQLSRDVEREHPYRPQARHCYEGGGIEAAADVLMYVYRPGYYGSEDCTAAGLDYEQHRNLVELGILMQRNGKSSTRTYLAYEGEHFKFRGLTPAEWQSLVGSKAAGTMEEDRESAYDRLGGGR